MIAENYKDNFYLDIFIGIYFYQKYKEHSTWNINYIFLGL